MKQLRKYTNPSSLYNPFLRFIERTWRIHIKRNIRRIGKLFQYLPVIWQNEEWDHYYLYRLIEYKIKRMRKYHQQKQGHVDWELTVAELLRCEELLHNLIEENHEDKKEIDSNNILTIIKADLLRKKDKEELFGILVDKIDTWWY